VTSAGEDERYRVAAASEEYFATVGEKAGAESCAVLEMTPGANTRGASAAPATAAVAASRIRIFGCIRVSGNTPIMTYEVLDASQAAKPAGARPCRTTSNVFCSKRHVEMPGV